MPRGRQEWDNRLSARLERLWPELQATDCQCALRLLEAADRWEVHVTTAAGNTKPIVTRISGPTVTATGLFGGADV